MYVSFHLRCFVSVALLFLFLIIINIMISVIVGIIHFHE